MTSIVLGLLVARAAWGGAELPPLDAQLFHPSPDAQTLLGTEDSFVPDELRGTGRLLLQWAHQPVVYYPDEGAPQDLVAELLQLDVLAALAWHRVRLGLDLPVVLRSVGDLSGGETGLGDLSLGLKGRLLDRRRHGFGAALVSRLSLPTATTDAPLGAEGVGWAVGAVADYQRDALLVSLNAGTAGIPAVELSNLRWDDQLQLALGASYAFTEAWGLGLELGMRAPWRELGNPDAIPAEALLGGWFRPGGGDWVVRGGAGSGLTGGLGAPKVRAVLTAAWDPPLPGLDRDGDGVADDRDACPDQAEDLDAWEDQDGCPEPTRVRVAVVDAGERPVDGAEVVVHDGSGQRAVDPGAELELQAGRCDVRVRAPGFQDQALVLQVPAGAPWQALVALVALPQEGLVSVRVRDGAGAALEGTVAFGDRTPELTHQGASYATLADGPWALRVAVPGYRPLAQEVVVHGGEEVVVVAVMEKELVTLTRERIEIHESIFFETAKAAIKPESHELLAQIAGLLQQHPELLRVRIEGHTDSRGSAAANLRLSQDRAAAVRAFLMERGVEPKRLVSVGYGETRPLDAREVEAAWSQNRRVDFWIEERAD